MHTRSSFASPLVNTTVAGISFGVRALNTLQPVAALGARLYVANVFFTSGLTKLRDWNITLALFMDEYKVPFLAHDVAAVLGTGGELVLPVLLALGLGSRFAAIGLSVVNVVAVLALADIAPAALQQHQFWGALFAGLAVFGPGRFALDHFVQKYFGGAVTKPDSRTN
jgi:putative oxidoreductase